MINLMNIYILVALLIWGMLGLVGISAFIINKIYKCVKHTK